MLRSMRYGLHGAVIAGLIAAPVAWHSVDKTVKLVVDGTTTTVHTTAGRVGQVLAAKGYHPDAHDLVAPSPNASLSDGMKVVLRRGRLLQLNVDGRRTEVWTTAPTVEIALAQLGYTTTDFVSVSRSRRLPLGVTDIAIRTPRMVTVVHDGTRNQLMTTDGTVGQVLDDMGILLRPQDRVSPALPTVLSASQTITVQRLGSTVMVRSKSVPYSTSRVADGTMPAGTTKVLTAGRDGLSKLTYSVVYVDGKAIGTTLLSSVLVLKPRTEVVKVGTQRVVTQQLAGGSAPSSGGSSSSVPTAPAPSPGTAKAIAQQMLTNEGMGQDQYDCLVQIWNHESGWRVHAANPSGAYGIPQALPGSKMASAGPDWQNNATTQITWGLGYIKSRYGTPCGAWASWQANGWY
ncbi:MAG TPA: ubiquitin-like domain-containing protein [Jatrophihabitans sp.]|uniref:aggregation-promoting factor C-terminal-like domain-containing protein n=1 Tax=Jatrophihabitans sp. TaxID=1932789 RepID=UPI002DFEEB3E|nr:ubiquitin-like domain-containing protein [Jatrophihabitans sp.]